MNRFAAALWNRSDAAETMAASQFSQAVATKITDLGEVWQSPGFYVAASSSGSTTARIYRSDSRSLVILGRLYPRTPATSHRRVTLSRNEVDRVLDTKGQHLINAYWGEYVALLITEPVGECLVMRDPCGALPCFVMQYRGTTLLFSSANDCVKVGLTQFSFNWPYIHSALTHRGSLRTHETGLNEVTEILGGECVRYRAGAESGRSLVWDAVAVAVSAPIEDPAQAVEEVRTHLCACVSALASHFSTVLLRLSGGLDSTVVLLALREAARRPAVICVNSYDDSVEGDERRFAREAASSAGCPLIEVLRDPSQVDLLGVLNMKPAFSPPLYIHHITQGLIESKLAQTHDAEVIFEGVGGDQLFYRDERIFAAADYFETHGPIPSFASVVLGIARLEAYSVWHVMRHAFRHVLFDTSPLIDPISSHMRFVTTEVQSALLDDARHFNDLRHLPPGKRLHVHSLATPVTHYDPFGALNQREIINPLLSQPIIETCLRIPTYLHTLQGRDRAVERSLFLKRMPPSIQTRISKGGATHFYAAIIRSNREFFRSFMLDGLLAQQGLLNTAALEEFLSADIDAYTVGVAELMNTVFSMEVWLRNSAASMARPASMSQALR